MKLRPKLRALFRKEKLDAEMAEEMRAHLELHAAENEKRGMSRDEAHYLAQRAFGGVEQIKEQCRDQRGSVWLEQFFQDLRQALRSTARNPLVTLLSVITLALAMGVTAAIFTITDAVWFRPLPYAAAGELRTIAMMERKTGQRTAQIPGELLRALEEQQPGVTGLARGKSASSPTVQTPEGAKVLRAVAVNARYFETLGVSAAKGRLFNTQDVSLPGRPAVLAYTAWRDFFAGDENMIGRAVAVGNQNYDILGVLPENFVFPSTLQSGAQIVTLIPPADAPESAINPVVRLAKGVSPEQAQEMIGALARTVATRNEEKTGEHLPVLEDVGQVLYPTGRPVMGLLLMAAGIVVLIGCANVAQMMKVKQCRRAHEAGVRVALGASRLRLVRPLLMEGLLIGLGGASLALLANSLTLNALLSQVPANAIRGARVVLDTRVILFTLGLGSVVGLSVGVLPALAATRFAGEGIRGTASRIQGRLGYPMIAVQVALAVVLVGGAAAVTQAFLSVLRVPLGFSSDNVLRIVVQPSATAGLARQEYYVRALELLSRRPDVIVAGAVGSAPLDATRGDEGVARNGTVEPKVAISYFLPGFFEAAGIRLVRGRLPDRREIAGDSNLAVVSESAAAVLFPGQEPLGGAFSNDRGTKNFSVVGVVADVVKTLDHGSSPLQLPVYVVPGSSTRALTMFVKMRTHGPLMAKEIRRDLEALDPSKPITIEWWSDAISSVTAYRNPRFQTLVLGSFSVLSLVLVTLGIFAVVGFLVTIREREFGVRLALGATPGELTTLVLRQTALPVGMGLLVGLVATRYTGRLVETYLSQAPSSPGLILGLAVPIVLTSTLLAALLPALRAAKVDPMVALRAE